MSFFRAKRYLRSRLEPVKIPARVPFVVDDELVKRREQARAALPVNNCKRLIEPQPEPVRPRIDIPEDSYPIG